MMVLGFKEYESPAKAIASALMSDYLSIEQRKFPDGESLVKVPTSLPEHVIIVRSLDQPSDKLIELLFAATAVRKHGAKRITLVAPYLCYMRQDIENIPGEAVSQKIIGKIMAEYFDDVITIDPHLHRIDRLDEAIPLKNAISLSAGPALGKYIRDNTINGLLLGPDSESRQWVAFIAEEIGYEYVIAEKTRTGDREVAIQLPNAAYNGKSVTIIDDMASTGQTIIQASKLLLEAGVTEINAAVTHGLFSASSLQQIYAAGIKNIWSTDTIYHKTNVVSIAQLVADKIKCL